MECIPHVRKHTMHLRATRQTNMSENRMISGHAPNRTCRTFLGPTPWNKNILRTFGHLGWYLMAVRGPLVRRLGLVPSGATWTRQRAGFRPSRGLPRDLLECGLGSAADYIVIITPLVSHVYTETGWTPFRRYGKTKMALDLFLEPSKDLWGRFCAIWVPSRGCSGSSKSGGPTGP